MGHADVTGTFVRCSQPLFLGPMPRTLMKGVSDMPRTVLARASKSYSTLFLLLVTFLAALMLPWTARGQGLEVSGGWAHVTQDFGTDGFNLGAAWWFTNRVSVAADYDSGWDTSSLSNFAFTQVGAIAVKSHLQSFLVGPRVFFSRAQITAARRLLTTRIDGSVSRRLVMRS